MEEITPDNLRESVEKLSIKHKFLIDNLFAAKDDHSLPEIEDAGLMRRDEILIGCQFYDNTKSKKVSLEYRLFEGEFNSFIAVITDRSFEWFPEAKEIIERGLCEAGIKLQSNKGAIVAELYPSINVFEKFLSTYFQAQKQADKYINECIKISEKILNLNY